MIALVVSVLLTAALLAWVSAPLFGRKHRETAGETADSAHLERKHAVYRAILDLEHDRKLGKVEDSQYAVMRTQLESEAAAILDEMDTLLQTGDPLEEEIATARRRRAQRE